MPGLAGASMIRMTVLFQFNLRVAFRILSETWFRMLDAHRSASVNRATMHLPRENESKRLVAMFAIDHEVGIERQHGILIMIFGHQHTRRRAILADLDISDAACEGRERAHRCGS